MSALGRVETAASKVSRNWDKKSEGTSLRGNPLAVHLEYFAQSSSQPIDTLVTQQGPKELSVLLQGDGQLRYPL